ncbi:enhancer of rudimentary homolog isoform X2 [Aphis gossypii]|uniref:Enhancer of rudimentary n=1 Tax=Aphis gossypii TaxID=80765 RepID=A0A9P0J7I4_APHGO|nr:enhancer of rudimentary homolog isoform X2 [Aphis gossypii]CAH1732364.1 unnamed protein product [Aphis gossypii]
MSDVILFLQSEIGSETRTRFIYDSVKECMEGICKIYEAHLMQLNPNVQIPTFKMTQLFEFIDHLPDIKCFVFQRNTKTYASFNKNWIKEKIHEVLKCQATQRQLPNMN